MAAPLLPEVSHTHGAAVSDEHTHAPVRLVMHRRKDEERSRLRLIYAITTKGIGFLSRVVLSLSLLTSLCPFLCLTGAGPLGKTIPRISVAPVEKLFFCELWGDGAVFKCLDRGWF